MLAAVSAAYASVVSYVPDNTTIFPNPERGFTEELSYKVTTSHPNVIKGELDDNWGKADNMTLMVVLYNFNKFKDKDIPETILSAFDEDMNELRKHGLKCVLRFAYTESQSDKTDATPEWVKRHLEQLKSHLAENADVIYVLEAGFIGSWGEWYYTKNYGNESQHMNDNRRKVIEYLFANAPEDRFILFRYPIIKTEYLNDETPLSETEAFTGTVRARMGCHNDAFLNKYGNDGTYGRDDDKTEDDPVLRQYVASETLYVPNGGETNVEKSSLAEEVYAQAPAEMSTYHWSFCGSTYATPVTNRWRESGIFDTLNIHMGYRLSLIEAQYSDTAKAAGKMSVSIRLRNTGYAPLYNERTVYLVLKNGSKTVSLPLQADPRRWLPNNAESVINEEVSIPADISGGVYQLYLHLPDQYPSIASDPRYAVRLANKDVWDAETGMNNLGASVVIQNDTSADIQTETTHSARPQKRIENGIFYIVYPDGRRYTVLGQ